MGIKNNFRQALNEVIQEKNGLPEEMVKQPQIDSPAAKAPGKSQPEHAPEGQKQRDQKPSAPAHETQGTIITPDTQIEGSVRTSSPLFLAGLVQGDVHCTSSVTITGKLQGNLRAESLVLNGSVIEGNITVSGAVEVSKGSMQIGDLSAKSAVINGSIKGCLQIEEALVLQKEAHILGDIKTGFLEISRGAAMNGNLTSLSDDPAKSAQRFNIVKQKKAAETKAAKPPSQEG